jgi:hypothetical protein
MCRVPLQIIGLEAIFDPPNAPMPTNLVLEINSGNETNLGCFIGVSQSWGVARGGACFCLACTRCVIGWVTKCRVKWLGADLPLASNCGDAASNDYLNFALLGVFTMLIEDEQRSAFICGIYE